MKESNSSIVKTTPALVTMLYIITSSRCLCGDIYYYASMKRENLKWYNENYLYKAFSGTVSYVNYTSKDSTEAVFVLRDLYTEQILSTGAICLEEDSPLKQVVRGDTIAKDSGTILVTIKFLNSEFAKTPMQWCDF